MQFPTFGIWWLQPRFLVRYNSIMSCGLVQSGNQIDLIIMCTTTQSTILTLCCIIYNLAMHMKFYTPSKVSSNCLHMWTQHYYKYKFGNYKLTTLSTSKESDEGDHLINTWGHITMCWTNIEGVGWKSPRRVMGRPEVFCLQDFHPS